jgi:PilZ domain
MKTAALRSRVNDMELDPNQTQSRLDQLERHEWWRWSVAVVVMLALTFGLLALSIPVIGGRDWAELTELNIALRGLLALILLFDIFVIYQQMLITRLRRDLATQLRVGTTLETLKKADGHANSPQRERRRSERADIDRRVRVNTLLKGKSTCFYGRIRDISQEGMGAVIPCSLSIDEQVTLEFSLEDGHESTVSAIVCHCQGFHYGFDFVSIQPSLREAIARITEPTAAPVDRPLSNVRDPVA